MTKKILIIYHTQSGFNEKLAEACFDGALKETSVEVRFKNALATTITDIKSIDGLIIISPEYFGYMAGAIKDFFDRTFYAARDLNINLPYALIIGCENDGSGAQRGIEAIAKGYVLKKALDIVIVKNKDINNGLLKAHELGQAFSAGIALGIF